MKNKVIAKAMLVVFVLGLSTFFGSLPAVQAGYVQDEIGTATPQMDHDSLLENEFLTPESVDDSVPNMREEVMSPADVKAELDQIYRKETNRYSQLSSSFETLAPEEMKGISYTNQMIIKFISFEAREAFTSNIPTGVVFNTLKTLPYVTVPKTTTISNILLQTSGIVRIMDDMIQSAPEYTIYEQDEIEYELAMYNSEGRIGSWDMHDLGFTGEGIRIAVLDTGIDSSHPDLMYTSNGDEKIIAEQSFIDVDFNGVPDEGPEDMIGHGTHVAGTAAGNGYHVGVAPDAYLMNAKVCSYIGCATSWMIEAVEWAILNDADIISMSIGGSTFWGLDALDDILDYAWQQGIVVTIAAGNDGPAKSSVQSPGTGPRVITCAASDGYDLITAFSGRGVSAFGHFDPDVAAPGDYIFSTLPGGTYGIYGGTSMATPHIAGAVALLLEAHPRANPDMVKANLMSNAKNIDLPTTVQGAGLVDLVETHDEWNKRLAILFPTFNEQDVLHLSPGETFSGYFSYVNSRRDGIQPWFRLDDSTDFDIVIDREGLFPDLWKYFCGDRSNLGQQFIPFTVTAPSDAQPSEQFSRDITAYFWKGTSWRCGENPFKTKMTLTIEINQAEDDALTGTDAGDTFPGATEVPLGNYSGFLGDIDYYKVWLEADLTYTFVLDGFVGWSDFDLAIYNESGVMLNYGYTGGPEQVSITTEYAGYYIIRVDPWSLMLDPWWNMDSSGPYNLWMIEGGPPGGGGGGETGTQVEYLGIEMHGIDFDADSIYDYMAVTVTLNVISPGLLDMYAFLALDKSPDHNKWLYGLAYVEMYELADVGIHEITMLLDGTLVADQNFVGSHVVLELFLGDPSTFTTLLDLLNVYTSPVFDSTDFGSSHLKYVGYYTETIDEDADGDADWLAVDVTVEITETFDWESYFTCTLYHPDGYFFWSVYDEMLDLSIQGPQTLHFLFDPANFVNAPTGILNLELVITYSWNHPLTTHTMHFGSIPYILTIGETIPVDLADFGSSGGTNKIIEILDYGLDMDGDTTFDYLVFDVTIQLDTAGYYALSYHPWLWSITDQEVTFVSRSVDILWFEAGIHSMSFVVEGEQLNGAKNDGPFLVLYFWLDAFEEGIWGLEWTGTVDEVQNYVTDSYLSSEFDKCGARFLGIVGSDYADLDADGEAESIEIIMEFDVGYPGYFDAMMLFYSYPVDTVFSFGSYEGIFFDSSGLQTYSIFIDGTEFYKQQFKGTMELWMLDIYSFGNTSYKNIFFSYQNGLFNVDYECLPGARPAAAIYSVSDYGIDADGNGLYEYLAVSVTIDVRTPKDLILMMDVFGDASTGWWSYVGYYEQFFTAFEPGLLTIELLIPAAHILGNTYDDYTNFELWFNLVDATIWNQIDFVGPVYTDWYYKSDFEVPISIIGVSDYGLDEDANGLYEGIVVDVLIESTTPGVFILDMIVFGDASTGYMTFVGFDSVFFEIIDEGQLTVSLFISASDINANVMDEYTDFQLEFHLLDGITYSELAYLWPVYTNWYYKADFEATSTIFDVYDYGEDSNGNGLYDAIIIDVILDIATPGEYIIDVIVFGDASTGYMTEVGYYSVYVVIPDVGLWSVPVTVPSADILSSVTDTVTDFEVIISLMDYEYNELDFLAPYYTDYYNISDFELAWDYSTSYVTYDADGDFCNDTIDIYADFAFYSLNNVTVDLYLDMWFWNETLANWTYIDTQVDGFVVTENPGFYSVVFNYQAAIDGTHAFVLSIYIDGVFLDYETIYFYDACAYNP